MVRNDLTEQVFATLAKRRERCKDYLEKKQDFLNNDKIYYELARKIAKLNAIIGKNKANELDTKELLADKLQLEQLAQQRITELKVKKSDLQLKHYCKKCLDTGYLNGKPCSCFIKIYNKLRIFLFFSLFFLLILNYFYLFQN